MAFTHGKDSVFSLDDTGGSLQDISAYVNSVDGLPGDIDMAETTTLGNESKTYIAGLDDAQVTVAGIWDSTLDGYVGSLAQRKTARTFEWGPEGSTASNVKVSGEGFIQSYTASSPVGDIVTFSMTIQVTGGVTIGTY
jgi:hypothetical protein